MLDMEKLTYDINVCVRKVNNNVEYMSSTALTNLLPEITMRLVDATIREHELQSIARDHPAIQEIRDQMTVMMTLLNKRT